MPGPTTPDPRFDVDLFVIGAGSGGVRAARIAAGYGARVMVAEEYRVGGTCVIRGCVPKKLLVYASRFADSFEDAEGFGWSVPPPSFDWPTLIAAKDKEIARLEEIYSRNLNKAGVTIVPERAELDGANAVRLASGKRISAKTILIATGARPSMPEELDGHQHAISSNEAFDLKTLPKRIAIAGGGYIAVEFAGIFAGLGSEVTLVYRGTEILRPFDIDMKRGVAEAYQKRGIKILTNTVFERIETTGAGLKATLRSGAHLDVDQVMFAIGRKPNVAGLGLETAGVALGEDSAIIVDGYSRTNVPSIYAVGDVTNRINLTPVAIREGHAFADTVFGDKPTRVDHANIPTAVFSTPEIGTVGITEQEARRTLPVLNIFRTSFRPMAATLSGRDEKVIMKLLVNGETDRVVGAHILGPDAGEMAQLLGVLLVMGATKRDFDRTMALHPSAAEELVTMREPSERVIRSSQPGEGS
jgi:glutathione reductase (NADPH)